MKINPEKLAYWYFRLNGCFTLTNFVVHPSEGREQRTDVDIFAVRLPYRCELLVNPMQDDDVLLPNGNRTKLILAEVKKETCNLNGPWTKRERSNMQLAIAAAGAFSPDIIEEVANELYDVGVYQDERFQMMLFCIGSRENRELRIKYPLVPQVTWQHILKFIYNRFNIYRDQKHNHAQWDTCGKELFRLATRSKIADDFIKEIELVA